MGPTAVGKTALSIAIAKYFSTQIISADSRQCFRELNIGVAKPSVEELDLVRHYFINSHSIHENVNAAVFEEYALEKVKEIFAEATLPYPSKSYFQTGGKEGKHTEHLGYILAEMQYMQRVFPGREW